MTTMVRKLIFVLDLPWDLHEVCEVSATEESSLAVEIEMIKMSAKLYFRSSNNSLSMKIKHQLVQEGKTTICVRISTTLCCMLSQKIKHLPVFKRVRKTFSLARSSNILSLEDQTSACLKG